MKSRLLSTAAALLLLLGLVSTSAFAQISSSSNVNFYIRSYDAAGDMISTVWRDTNTGATIDPSNAVKMFTSSNPSNRAIVKDSNYEALFDQFNNEADMTKAVKLIVAMDKYAIEQHWVVHTIPFNYYNVTQPYLKGYYGEDTQRSARGSTNFCYMWIDK